MQGVGSTRFTAKEGLDDLAAAAQAAAAFEYAPNQDTEDQDDIPDLESSSDEKDEAELPQKVPQRKRAVRAERAWVEQNRWDRSELTDTEIAANIKNELNKINTAAGIHFLRQHADRKFGQLLGDWTYLR